jgi:hypothetical protein
MSMLKNVLGCVAFGLLLAPLAAQAGPLTIVNVNAPAINCVFNPACTVVVTDSLGTFVPPGDAGIARLQSRTYVGAPGAPAAGLTAYEYRVDLTSATAPKPNAANCVKQVILDIGPIAKLNYLPPSPTHASQGADVFVVTSGGLGTIGLSAADQVGNVVTFTFTKPVCPKPLIVTAVIPGETSFFFGLAAKTAPKPSTAKLVYTLGGNALTAARVPMH